MKEVWKPIKGYESLYEVSSLGRVRRTENYFNSKSKLNKQFMVKVKGRILKNRVSRGYYIVNLCCNSKAKNYRVHRLVAETFLPNPNNYPCINHKNGIKTDNRVGNLEWCSYSYNNKEAYRMGLKKPTWEGKCYEKHPSNHPIMQLDKLGNIINYWHSIQEAQDKLLISNISAVCRGCQKTAGGYIWKYFEGEE